MGKYIIIKNKEGNYNISLKMWIPETEFKEIFILCHGFASCVESPSIGILANDLLKLGIASIAFDFPFHGKSKITRDKLTVENCINDIRYVENYIKRKFKNVKISLFGVSFGGYIILNKILIDNNYDHIILRAPAIQMGQILKNHLIKEDLSELDKKGFVKAGVNGKIEITKECYEQFFKYDLTNIKLDRTIFIVQGSLDTTADICETRKFVKNNINKVQIIEVPNSKHFMSPPEIQEVSNIITKYLKREVK